MNIVSAGFAQRYCEVKSIPRERFVDAVLPRVMYPHARWIFLPVARCFGLRWLDEDREILADVGCAADIGGVAAVLSRIPWYYQRHWSVRRLFRFRISSRRVMALARRLNLARERAARLKHAEAADRRGADGAASRG